MTLLTDLLNLFKHIIFNDTLMGSGEDCLILYRIIMLLLVPNGVGVCLKVDDTGCILSAFKDMHNSTAVPSVSIFGIRVRYIASVALLISCWRKNLFLAKYTSKARITRTPSRRPTPTGGFL